jgi:hypothetical protein
MRLVGISGYGIRDEGNEKKAKGGTWEHGSWG